MKSIFILLSLLFIFNQVQAKPIRTMHYHYYGNLRKALPQIPAQQVKATLTAILANAHIYTKGKPDVILNTAKCSASVRNCYGHRLAEFQGVSPKNSYRNARHVLYQAITPVKVAPGIFHFNPIYFSEPLVVRGNDDFRFFEYVNKNKMNAEHIWPQSKFGGHKNAFHNRFKKSDLHHIYPANARMNSDRGSFPFAEIRHNNKNPKYGNVVGRPLNPTTGARLNRHTNSQAFMPIPSSRGRVARAMMYFSTRYDMKISPLQEYYIRKWHREYPVTKEEKRRNNRIFKYQLVRNPFVDYPKLEKLITDF